MSRETMVKLCTLLLLLIPLPFYLYGAGDPESGSSARRTAAPAPANQEELPVQPESDVPPEPVNPSPAASNSPQETPAQAAPNSPQKTPAQETSAAAETSLSPESYTGPPRLLVLPLIGVPKAEGENVALFIANISELNTVFKVLNPRILSWEPSIANYQVPSADITDRGIIALGKRHNAEYVLGSQLTRLGDHQVLILTLINVGTGQLVSGGYREIREVTDLHLLLPNIVIKMVQVTEIDTAEAPDLGILPFTIPSMRVTSQDANVLVHLLIIEVANTGKYKIVRRISGDQTPLEVPYMLMGNIVQIGAENQYFLAQIIESDTSALRKGGEVQYRTISDGVNLMSELAYKLTNVQAGGMPGVFIPDNLVWVAGGSFLMGNREYDGDEKPVHTVQVNSFFMGKTQVTQEEYYAVMGTNPSGFSNPYAPVEQVTWYEAIEYCNKLSRKEGLIPAYYGTNDQITCDFTANGYRLPTEAEWEYAARGGNSDTLAFDRAGGNRADAVGWYAGNSKGTTHSAAGKIPNSLGLYDMAGNVWEWCWDWYGPYEDKPQYTPRGPVAGKDRVVRGGSWNSEDTWLRSTYRNIGSPAKRYKDVGFRVVRPNF